MIESGRPRPPQATTGSAGGARLGVVLFPMTTTVIILHEPTRRVRRYRYRVSIGPSRSLTEFNTTILFVTHVSTTASTTTSGGGCGQPDRSVALYADVGDVGKTVWNWWLHIGNRGRRCNSLTWTPDARQLLPAEAPETPGKNS